MQTRSPRPARPSRRLVLKGAVAGLIGLAFAPPALGQGGAALARGLANGLDYGLVPGAAGDQSAALQRALNEAAALGIPLFLPGGRYEISAVALPARSVLLGAGPQTVLAGRGGGTVLSAQGADDIAVMDLSVDGSDGSEMPDRDGLIAIRRSSGLRLERIAIANAAGNGLYLEGVAGRLRDLDIGRCTRSAIFALDGTGLSVSGAAINDCGNAGIRIWRERPGSDGTILTGNRIARIDWTGGGNGQNGNGINVFNADDVIVSDNHLSDCAFSAIRLNTTANVRVSGNTCLRSGEVAIFSEFGFSGSLIADNLIDGAALGISMTNFDTGGRLAICSGNLVRNIAPASAVNPDTVPVGIFAEADAVVTGNIVEDVPGTGILAGWGPYLRDVLVTDNLVRNTDIGIAASVAPGAGRARIAGNLITGARRHAIAGMAWSEVVAPDLVAEAAAHPHLAIGENTIG